MFGIRAAVAGIAVFCGSLVPVACGGDTFSNEPSGATPDAGGGGSRDSGADVAPKPGCAPGLSENAFCSNFDRSTRPESDGWVALGSGRSPDVRVINLAQVGQTATSGSNALYVSNNDASQAFIATSRPNAPKRFKLAFDLRMLQQGDREFVPVRVSVCPSSSPSGCYALQLRFLTSASPSKPVAFEEATGDDETLTQCALGGADTRVIDQTWSRVVLDVNLTGAGAGTAGVTFGSARTCPIRPPADIVDHIHHVELRLGAVFADIDTGYQGYQVYYDTLTFDPAPP